MTTNIGERWRRYPVHDKIKQRLVPTLDELVGPEKTPAVLRAVADCLARQMDVSQRMYADDFLEDVANDLENPT